MKQDKPYRTVLNWETGLTIVVCNSCEARSIAGRGFTHNEGCPEIGPRPKQRITEITKIYTFKVACEIAADGTVIMP